MCPKVVKLVENSSSNYSDHIQLNLRYAAPFPRYQYFNVGLRGNNILFWLALADTFAAFGTRFCYIITMGFV
jgi:hypothetical protein